MLQQVKLFSCQHDEFLVGEGECPIRVGILFAFDLASKVVVWDNHVRREEDIGRIVDRCPTGNDLRVVGVKVGVEELNVSFDS